MTSSFDATLFHDPAWRSRLYDNMSRMSATRIRRLFSELNPHLVGDKLFEDRWSDIRKDAAVLIAIILRPDPTVLLTVRSSNMPSHAGQIAFPGGKVALEDKNRFETAMREAEEEVALDRSKVEILGAFGVHKGGLGFAVTPVLGLVPGDVVLSPCPREVEEIFEVPLSFVLDLENHTLETHVHEGVDYNMFAIPYGRFHIWGLTAGILRTLAELLHDDASGD